MNNAANTPALQIREGDKFYITTQNSDGSEAVKELTVYRDSGSYYAHGLDYICRLGDTNDEIANSLAYLNADSPTH